MILRNTVKYQIILLMLYLEQKNYLFGSIFFITLYFLLLYDLIDDISKMRDKNKTAPPNHLDKTGKTEVKNEYFWQANQIKVPNKIIAIIN